MGLELPNSWFIAAEELNRSRHAQSRLDVSRTALQAEAVQQFVLQMKSLADLAITRGVEPDIRLTHNASKWVPRKFTRAKGDGRVVPYPPARVAQGWSLSRQDSVTTSGEVDRSSNYISNLHNNTGTTYTVRGIMLSTNGDLLSAGGTAREYHGIDVFTNGQSQPQDSTELYRARLLDEYNTYSQLAALESNAIEFMARYPLLRK